MRGLIEHCERVVVTLWEHIEGILGTNGYILGCEGVVGDYVRKLF